jgi:hypothetical protein
MLVYSWSMDATQVIESLDAGEIRQRIQALEGEQKALAVLLRAALVRERQQAKAQATVHGNEGLAKRSGEGG